MKERGIIFGAESVRAILAGAKTQTRRIVKPTHAPIAVTPWDSPGVTLYRTSGEPQREWYMMSAQAGALISCRYQRWAPTKARRRRERDRLVREASRDRGWNPEHGHRFSIDELTLLCPYGAPGDRLWVRETWAAQHDFDACQPSEIGRDARWHYAATEERGGLLWRTPIFMPRWASRIVLEIAEVRVQRLHEITEDDARAEGVDPFFTRFPNADRDQRLDGELCADAEHRASFKCLWDEINGDRALWTSNPWAWVLTFKRVEPAHDYRTPTSKEG